ncbi:autotransporter domain-containing protein [Hyphomonas sp.]|uniref:autotransporter domain-containing protein n=1 Tax=Hyphomonas sp. TaxID=87 RepID=UPI003918AE91
MNLFRKLLVLSVSSISLAAQARATEITTTTTSPVSTSTLANGAPDDLVITDNGSIEVSDTPGFVAVTLDSSNDVTIDGAISIEDSDNTTGVYIVPGVSGNLTLSGSIALTEDYTREDTDDDDDDDGVLAIGTTRSAITLGSGAPLAGSISLASGSSVLVEGNDSSGLLLLSPLTGDLTTKGSISVIGTNAQGITASGLIAGDVLIGGSVSVVGEGGTALRLDDGVTGATSLNGSLISTGFVFSSSSNYVAPALVTSSTVPLEDRFDADELLVGGPTVVIGASLGQGLLINGAVIDPDLSDDESEDDTKDTTEDFNENRASAVITSYGSAPALLISADWNGTATEDLILGEVLETVRDTLDDDDDDDVDEALIQFAYDYGLINRGTISAYGTNVGFDSLAVAILGSSASNYSTLVSGGIYNSGTITSSAYEANATGILLGTNTQVPTLINAGTIQALIASEIDTTAVALDIAGTASLSSFENSGTITSRATGNAGTVYAVRDQSGTLNSVINTGSISAHYLTDSIDLTVREDGVAFDLSANTTGVTLHQYERAATYDANGDDEINALDTLDPSLTGNILFGAGDDQLILEAGTLTGDVAFAGGANTLTASDTTIDGDVSFEGLSSSLLLTNSAVLTGDVSFGASGTSSFVLTDGATYAGTLTNSGSQLAVDISASRIRLDYGSSVAASSLSFGSGTELILAIDPATATSEPVLDVTGSVSIASGVTISPIFTRVLDESSVYTIIEADDLSGSLNLSDISLTADAPYIYLAELQLTEGDSDTLDLVYRLKTASELELDVNESSAYSAVLDLFGTSDRLSEVFASISTEKDFSQAYNQLMPQRSDASVSFLNSQTTAAFGALADQMNLLAASPGRAPKAWIQESFTFSDVKTDTNIPGYNGSGFAVSAGIDLPVDGLDAFGVMMNFSSGRYEEKSGGDKPVSTTGTGVGVYALKQLDKAFVRGAAQVAKVDFSSSRDLNVIFGEPDNFRSDSDVLDGQDISDTMSGDWQGYSLAATVAAGTEFRAGSFYARPEVSAEYFRLQQDAYKETALRYGDLALEIGSAESERAAVSALLALGKEWDVQNGLYKVFPEIRMGVRHQLLDSPYSTTSRFANGDETFLIESQETAGTAAIGGFSLNSSSDIFTARLSYDVELSEGGTVHYIGASGVLRF